MLSSQKRKSAESEAFQANYRIREQFGQRIYGYISALVEYNETDPDDSQNVKDHIVYLKSLYKEINDAILYHLPPSVYRNEKTLRAQCAFYDQLMRTMVEEKQTKQKLLNQFGARISGYIKNLSDYIDICYLRVNDPTEHTRMTEYKKDLENILAMLRSKREFLYTDEATLNKDCAHLDELMRTTVKPKTDEGMALRTSLRTQYQERMEGLLARLSFLYEKVHDKQLKNVVKNTQNNELSKLCRNDWRIPDSAELQRACERLEECRDKFEPENKETASAAPRR